MLGASALNAGFSHAMKRALRSAVKNCPSAKNRFTPRGPPRRAGHCTGSSALNSSSSSCASAPISKSRVPSFSKADSAACSRKTSATDSIGESLAKTHAARDLRHDPPIGLCFAWRLQERPLARDAPLGIGDGAILLSPGGRRQQNLRAGIRSCRSRSHCPTRRTDRACASESRTARARGKDTAGLVPMTHSALISPRSIASNICTAFRPSRRTTFGAFQKRPTRSISAGENAICAASWLASPPTSRPPIAFGWPVSENGPMPGLPMRPVARWQLMMLVTLSVPCADWFTPCEKQVTTFGVARNNSKKRETSAALSPARAAVATASGAISRARTSASAKPDVWASI